MIILKKTSGFTLLELMIAMTIFAVMSVAVISIYIQTTVVGQKLRATRHLSETAREITERIADDVRKYGISVQGSQYDDHSLGNDLWKHPNYTLSGGEILGIGNENDIKKRYVFGKINTTSKLVERCSHSDKKDNKIHCGLYVLLGNNWSTPYNLVDTFVPEEEKKRVKVENLNFFISGDGIMTEKKVTIVFTLILLPRIGIPLSLSETKVDIQTTLSERFFHDIN